MKILKKGTLSTPLGFKTNAVCCGLKKNKLDLALIYSIVKAKAYGVFTKNKVKAAPVIKCISNLKNNQAQAIIVNSANANCCTGSRGEKDTNIIVKKLAGTLKINEKDVLMSSTGVIGKYLPKEKIINSLPVLVKGLGFDKAKKAAKAIMTTDTFSKEIAVSIKINKKVVNIAGIAKGAGMICPDMATMLCYITTDANIANSALKQALKTAVDESFNCITVDGQMSTNDSVIILANGLASNKIIQKNSAEFKVFVQALRYVCLQLAKMIVKDAEGATRFIQIKIKNAKTKSQAKVASEAIANSLLVKTMIAGHNPNWGRIPAALGASGINMKVENIKLFLQGKLVFNKGNPVLVEKNKLIKSLKQKQIDIEVVLNSGKYEHTVYSNDLTTEYVKVNMAYN